MDKDLLDKYFSGQCTPEEIERVTQWLKQPVANEKLLLRKSWRSIRTQIRTAVIRPLNPWPRYVAAASVALLTVGGISWKLISDDFVFRNNSESYEAFNANGLQFRLPPKAAAKIDNAVGSGTASVVFCGPVRIANNSENDVDMKLNLNCASPENSGYTMMLRVRKDQRYVAFQYHYKSEELVVVEEDRIFDLPLPLQQKALEVLEI